MSDTVHTVTTSISVTRDDAEELLLALSDAVDELNESAEGCAECHGSGASVTKVHANVPDTNCDDCNDARWASQLCEIQIAKLQALLAHRTDEQNSICDADSRASAEATASEGDDSTNGNATTEPEMESIAHATSGPEATSSQGNHSKVNS